MKVANWLSWGTSIMSTFLRLFPILVILLLVAGCTPTPEEPVAITLVVGGTPSPLTVTKDFTVDDVLRQANVIVGELDRVNPQRYNRVSQGMTITVVQIKEEMRIEQVTVPYEPRTILSDSLPTGERQMLQAGVNGVAEVTYRIIYEDGVETVRSEIKRTEVTSPQDEVIMIGSQGQLPAVTVNGTLAFISGPVSGGNIWIMTGNSASRRFLTMEGGIDGRVFELSDDGKKMLFTRAVVQTSVTPGSALTTPAPQSTSAPGGPFNTLWAVLDTTDPNSKPISLGLNNILYAEWAPGQENTFVYSTAEPRPNFPGWQANNDLWRARIDTRKRVTGPKLILEPSMAGIYAWYGTVFNFSPDGQTIAWAQADAAGVLGSATPTDEDNAPPPDKYERQTLVTFAPRNAYDFVWMPGLSWSPDSAFVATTTHGAPLGSEAAEDSPVYNVTAAPAQGGYSVDLVKQAGMWTAPQYSPAEAPDGTEIPVMIAYLQALQPLDQVSRYQLMVMDRDGSNPRLVFPAKGEPGLAAQVVAWSPDGRQIALIYQGNLYLVDVTTGHANQVTQDGLSSAPRWAP
jgi:hypothetical protein